MRSKSVLLAGLALVALGSAGGRAWADGEPLNGEQRMRQEAAAKVQEAMGPSFVPGTSPSAAPTPSVKQRRATAPAIRQVTAAANTGFRCLPSCATDDGRFLAIAGVNFQTLSPPELTLEISVPAGSTSFQVGIFDGDGGEYQSDGITAFWDSGLTAMFEYSLAADPTADATGTFPVDLAPGQPIVYSNTLPDNAWADFTLATGPEALSPSGNYFYVLRIRLADPSMTTLNAFKVRSTATLSGVTLNPVERPFSYIAPWTSLDDISVIYPLFPVPTPTTYDGTFSFYLDVPTSQPEIALWDGDFDHGDALLTNQDTDDPDTPNAPYLPVWSTAEVAPEGVATGSLGSTGNPPDDDSIAGFGVYRVRPPSVRYEVRFPDGQVFGNDNPSGNQEWEQFKIATAPFDPTQMDYSTATIPPGTYELRISGVDMLNLNALLLPFRVLCVDELGVVCQDIPRPFRVGDTVFEDRDGDGIQDSGEPGIPGVVLELRDSADVLISTTTTDADGHYSFDVESGDYTVAVAASNSAPGGALAGATATTSGSRSETVTDDNVLIYDFGYRGIGSIGDRVWYDTDGDGDQEAGEPGLGGTTVELLDGGGTVITTRTTDANGNYSFTNLLAGSYTVRVVPSTLPAGGLAPTYDLDGTGTAHTAMVSLAAGQTRTDADFGYRGTRSLGDRVWKDLDGDGVQDAGEPGINGVTVRLFLGSTEVASTVTAGDGNYSFTNLPETTFTVKIDTATLPAGATQTYDLDGLATPHQATVNLTGNRTDVDFGYKITATCTAGYFKDHFDTASFSNNNGTLSWAGSWIESDSAGTGVSSGNVTVGSPYGGYLFLRDYPDTGTQPSAARQVNLSTFASATLSFSFHVRTAVDPSDAVVVEVSSNGGASYTVLETLTGFSGTYTGSRSYNISAYRASNTRIRFRVSSGYGAGDELFKLDWIKIDAACMPTCTAGYFKDLFDTASFSNNNGTLSWAASWIESDSAGTGVSSGNVTVGSPYSGYLFLRDYPDTGTQPSAARQVNLSGYASATLSFSFHVRTAVDPDDAVAIEVSNNGGSSYTVLETLSGFSGTYTGSRSYNISAYKASNTRIRFRVTNNYGASDELFKLDWVKIDATCQ